VEALTGAQMKELASALMSAYPSYQALQQMLAYEVDRNLAMYSGREPLPDVVFNLVSAAEAEGWTDKLVTGAVFGNPGNPRLKRWAAGGLVDRAMATSRALQEPTEAGAQALLPQAGLLADGTGATLERIVKAAVGFQDIVPYASALLEQAARVCSISVVTIAGRSAGTGFLVGPDLVLTNHHVLADLIDNGAPASGTTCVFDYRVTGQGTVDRGTEFGLAPDWLVASSPPSAIDLQPAPVDLPSADELDYALVRLNGEPGRSLLPDGRERGWIELLATPPTITERMPLLIIQHPHEHPMKLAVDTDGVLGVNANRTRVMYSVNTLGGSSGSPCFTFDLALVALHHAAMATSAKRNEGVPIATIADHLRDIPAAIAALGG
jgi:hypothetical protein